ncbi:MAG: hypothetical protein ACYC3I_01410 [Gemmataceae bacterium]
MTFQVHTTILPGHRIEIQAPQLPEGSPVTVVVLVDEPVFPKRRLRDILADYPGGLLFRSAEEVDNYLRSEREAWDN